MPADPETLPPQRDAFDLPRDVVWANTAYLGPQPRAALDAALAAARRKSEPWRITPPDFFSEAETARARFAELIGASPDDVALSPAASYGIATAARNLPLERGQRVVMAADQFPSNVYAWKRQAEAVGAELVFAPFAETGDLTTALLEAIDARTAVVACAQAHWADGTRVDLHAVAERAHAVGAALVLDLTQSLGAVPFSVREIDPDFVAVAAYKWLLGPYATGFTYVAPRRQDGVPLEESWLGRDKAEDFANLTDYTGLYRPGARRFDVGEAPNFAQLPPLIASLELLLDWGVERIAATLSALNARLAEQFQARGFAVPAPADRSPHFFGVGLPANAPADLAARLAAEGVYLSVRSGKMRVSPHLWIDQEDEARLIAALDRQLA